MKINEKNLSAFAVSATPIDKEGFLNKRGEVNKNFQRRYFVLKGNLLFYFDKKGEKEPHGVIVLEGCTIALAEDEELFFCFKIEFHGANNRSYTMGAESQESMEQWMKALACSSYDYMKLMVAELQRQLDDVDDPPVFDVSVATNSPIPPPRTRHNPFNKPGEGTVPVRSSLRSSNNPGRSQEPHRQSATPSTSRFTITFKELHNSYGRPILRDLTIWRNQQRQLKESKADNLISF